MRAPFQAGEFPAPVKYGYASVGIVERGRRSLRGRRVFCLYPHQTRYVVPASRVSMLPDEVPSERAVLAANLETAINGVWDARPQVGDRVTVIGAGTVGCLVAWIAGRIAGCDVELVDLNPDRASIARALGVRFAVPASARSEADVVIHASGSPAGLALALRVAGFEATIVEMSWYGDQAVSVPLGEGFHARRLTIKSSQVGEVASSQRARKGTADRMALTLSMLADPVARRVDHGRERVRYDARSDGETRVSAGQHPVPPDPISPCKLYVHRFRPRPFHDCPQFSR